MAKNNKEKDKGEKLPKMPGSGRPKNQSNHTPENRKLLKKADNRRQYLKRRSPMITTR